MSKKWVEIIGWYGVIAILLAYLLNSLDIIKTSNIFYPLLNLTGSLGIIVKAWRQKDYQPIVLNLIWSTIAIISLIKLLI